MVLDPDMEKEGLKTLAKPIWSHKSFGRDIRDFPHLNRGNS